jgi:hypothetical protein
MKLIIILNLLVFGLNCKQAPSAPSTEKIAGVILALGFLDTMCNYRMVSTNITQIPTISIPATGKFRICGSDIANLRIVFEDYSKSYSVSGISGSITSGCPGASTSVIFSYLTESDSSTSVSTQIFNSTKESIPNFNPQNSKSYLVSSSGGGIGNVTCTQNNRPLVSTKDYSIVFSTN